MIKKGLVCPICGNETSFLMTGLILDKYNADYHKCTNCECIFISNPFWIEEAYTESIVKMDTGIMVRNLNMCNRLMILFNTYFDSNIKVVDYGAGYGILARMLRDNGIDTYWFDKYSPNLVSRGFEYDGQTKVDVILAFEVMEHLESPIKTIEEILMKTECFIFSTDLIPNFDFKTNLDWWYFAPEAGQHIFFYSEKTLKMIAAKFNMEYSKLNKLHIIHKKGMFSRKKISLMVKFLFTRFLSKLMNLFLIGTKFKSKTWDDHLNFRSKLT